MPPLNCPSLINLLAIPVTGMTITGMTIAQGTCCDLSSTCHWLKFFFLSQSDIQGSRRLVQRPTDNSSKTAPFLLLLPICSGTSSPVPLLSGYLFMTCQAKNNLPDIRLLWLSFDLHINQITALYLLSIVPVPNSLHIFVPFRDGLLS